LSTRICPECGKGFEVTSNRGKPKLFCTNAHKQAHANRMAVRGKQLAKIALGWRKARGSGDIGKFLFAEMNEMLDTWNAEDVAAKRMDATEYAALVVEFNPTNPQWSRRYFDRQPTKAQIAQRKEPKQPEPTPLETFISENVK
jgi:hypothetical protein